MNGPRLLTMFASVQLTPNLKKEAYRFVTISFYKKIEKIIVKRDSQGADTLYTSKYCMISVDFCRSAVHQHFITTTALTILSISHFLPCAFEDKNIKQRELNQRELN